jgi:hypothetical protein
MFSSFNSTNGMSACRPPAFKKEDFDRFMAAVVATDDAAACCCRSSCPSVAPSCAASSSLRSIFPQSLSCVKQLQAFFMNRCGPFQVIFSCSNGGEYYTRTHDLLFVSLSVSFIFIVISRMFVAFVTRHFQKTKSKHLRK